MKPIELSPEQENIFKEIQSKYEDEMIEARQRSMKYAIYHVINYRDVTQSDIDNLMDACGIDRHHQGDLELFFDL